MMALLSTVAGQGAHSSINGECISIGHGLPTVPKSLFDKFQWWEFMDLAELLLSQSTHNQMIAAQSNFSWFELVHPTRRQIESITEFSKAYMVYTAVLLKRFPKQASELLAYHLLIIKAASTRGCSGGLTTPISGCQQRRQGTASGPKWMWTYTPVFHREGLISQLLLHLQQHLEPTANKETGATGCHAGRTFQHQKTPVLGYRHLCLVQLRRKVQLWDKVQI